MTNVSGKINCPSPALGLCRISQAYFSAKELGAGARAGQGRQPGRAGQGRAGQGRAGQGRAGRQASRGGEGSVLKNVAVGGT